MTPHHLPEHRRPAILRFAAVLIALMAGLSILAAAPPSWWQERGVVRLDASTGQPVPADDYALVNQGQLKQFATQALAELRHRLAAVPGGTGSELEQHLQPFDPENPLPQTDDYSTVNLGQLKAMAKPFYSRLIQLGLQSAYPWANPAAPADDYALANLGQVKHVFAFEITDAMLTQDDDSDGVPNVRERAIGANPSQPDSDGDGLIDGFEVAAGQNPGALDGRSQPNLPTSVTKLLVFTPAP